MTEKIKAQLGDRVIIKILPEEVRDRINDESADQRRQPRFPYQPENEPLWSSPSISFFDIATSFAQVDQTFSPGWSLVINANQVGSRGGPANSQNGYAEMDSELITQDYASLKAIRTGYLAQNPFGFSQAAYSKRQVSNAWPLYHNCGQLFLDFYLKNGLLIRKEILHTANPHWMRRVSAADRLANFQSVKPYIDALKRDLIETQLKKETDELWHSASSALANTQGTLKPRGLLGSYDCRLDSLFYYEPFDIRDPVNYKATLEPNYLASEVQIPKLIFSKNDNQQVRCFMVPQYWRVTFRWRAWYLFVTWFAFTYVAVPGVAQFLNRFPLFPRPFELGSTDYPPVWFWIERSRAHSRAVDQDLALQFFSVFMAFIFLFTSDAVFEIRRTNTIEGMLAAVIEIAGQPYYLWRRLSTDRDLTTVISQGPLNTIHFNSFGTTIIGTSVF
jgi:hypothetical protein